MPVNTEIRIGDTVFKNPVFVASGTFGYGTETDDLICADKLGAIVTKSITFHPREGNPPPRIVETPSGMINSIGLANLGVEKFTAEILPLYDSMNTEVIVNIAGTTVEEYLKVLEKVESVPNRVCGYEINISCPNVARGGIEFGVDPEITRSLTAQLRERTDRLLIMKLSPNVTDIVEIGRAAEDAGADALSAINTVIGMSIDIASRRSSIATELGGLSGPAIRPVGIASVYRLSRAAGIPVIGIGGITSGRDAVEYLLAGSIGIQVGTANLRDPGIALVILDELISYCQKQGIESVSLLTGAMDEAS
ncbi:MAG: dihydroorotate dehydrogenase [Candidatus Neomarinimicrobiota bacterium]